MAYSPSADMNYYATAADPCGQDLANSQQQACGNAQKAYPDQQTGQIPTLSMQQEKLGYLSGVGAANGLIRSDAPDGLAFVEGIARKAVAGFYVSKTEIQIMAAFALGAALSE